MVVFVFVEGGWGVWVWVAVVWCRILGGGGGLRGMVLGGLVGGWGGCAF